MILGIDPGLRFSGLALVSHNGPNLPLVRARATVRLAADSQPEWAADAMAIGVIRWIRARVDLLDHRPELVALERFDHRPWLSNAAGDARRVNTSPYMGRLIGRLLSGLESDGWQVLEVTPGDSKVGYPTAERFRKTLLPRELRNRHERDAYLVAAYASSIARIHRAAAKEARA